jgi:hypothetical protein
MNKNIRIALVLTLGLASLFFGMHLAHAADPNATYTLLSPLPGVGTNGKVDVASGFGSYLNSIIRLVIGLIGVLAVVMLVVGGIQYMVSSGGGEKGGAKERMQNALFGLVLALSAYTILNTINPNLVTLTIHVPGATLSYDSTLDEPSTKTGTTTITVGGKTTTVAGSLCSQNNYSVPVRIETPDGKQQEIGMPILDKFGWPSDSGVVRQVTVPEGLINGLSGVIKIIGTNERQQLQNLDVSVSGADCSVVQAGQKSGCTSVYGMRTDVISKLGDLKKKCNCDVVVTGGTECWMHVSHGPGLDPVDLRLTDGLITYVRTAGNAGKPLVVGETYTAGTTQFYYEPTGPNSATSNHFHVRHW